MLPVRCSSADEMKTLPGKGKGGRVFVMAITNGVLLRRHCYFRLHVVTSFAPCTASALHAA